MKFATSGGLFSVMIYQGFEQEGKKGVHCRIHFFPTLASQDEKVALIQACSPTIKDVSGWKIHLTSAAKDERVAGLWFIDAGGSDNPAFGLRNSHLHGPERLKIENGKGTGYAGSDGKIGAWTGPLDSAYLDDRPMRSPQGNRIRHCFESVALCVCGARKGTSFGAIHWGYEMLDNGNVDLKKPFAQDAYTNEWREAARAWNQHPGLKIPGV